MGPTWPELADGSVNSSLLDLLSNMIQQEGANQVQSRSHRRVEVQLRRIKCSWSGDALSAQTRVSGPS